jgi:hypothetical protein
LQAQVQVTKFIRFLELFHGVIIGWTRFLRGQNFVLFLWCSVHWYRLPFDVRVPDVGSYRLVETGQVRQGAHEGAIDIGGSNVDVIFGICGIQ